MTVTANGWANSLSEWSALESSTVVDSGCACGTVFAETLSES